MCHVKYIRRLEGQDKMCRVKMYGTVYYVSRQVQQKTWGAGYNVSRKALRDSVLCVTWSTSEDLRGRLKCIM